MYDETVNNQLNCENNTEGAANTACQNNSQKTAPTSTCDFTQSPSPVSIAPELQGDEQKTAGVDQTSDAFTAEDKKKQHVDRSVSPEREAELIRLAVEKINSIGDGEIFDGRAFAVEQHVAINVINKIFLSASNLTHIHVKYKDKPEPKGLTISKKFNLMLKIEDFEEMNKTRDESQHFKKGDGFAIKVEDEQIILTRISSVA